MTGSNTSSVSLGGETAKATVAKVLMAAVGFLGTILFARLLGAEQLGSYYLIVTIVVLSNRTIGGISNAIQKRASESGFPVMEGVVVGLSAAVLWALLAGIVGFVFRAELVSLVGFDSAPLAFFLRLLSINVFVLYGSTLAAAGRVGRSQWVDAIRSYLTLPAQVAFVYVGLGPAGMVYGEVIATVVVLVPFLLWVIRAYERPSTTVVRSIWDFAKYSILNSYLGRLYSELDILLLGVLLSQTAVGYYGVAWRLSLPAMFLAMSASTGLFSRVSNRRSRDQEFVTDVENTLSFSSLFAIPMLFGAVVLMDQLVVTLYGPEFEAAGPILVGLLIFRVLQTQSSPLEKVVLGIDRPEITTRIYLVLLLVNVVVGVLLVPRIGAVGVVAATVLAEGARYGGLIYYLRRELPELDFLPSELLKQVGSGFLMGLVVFAGLQVVAVDSWTDLVTLVGGGGVTYLTVLLLWSRTFRSTIAGTLDDLYAEGRELSLGR